MFELTAFLLFGASFKKFKWLSWVFHLILMMRLFYVNDGNISIFFIVNALTFLLLPLILRSIKFGNNISSILVPLIWSVIIDTVSIVLFPIATPYLAYIWQGILFNYKGIFMPAVIVVGYNAIELYFKKKEKTFYENI